LCQRSARFSVVTRLESHHPKVDGLRKRWSAAIAKLDNLAAVALAGPTFRRGREILQSFAVFDELHTQLLAGVGFAIKRLSYSGRAANGTEDKDFYLKLVRFSLDLQQVANMNFAGRFGGLVIKLNSAEVTGAGSESASLEETRGPEPFINANTDHESIVAQKSGLAKITRCSQRSSVKLLPDDRLAPSLICGEENEFESSKGVKEQPHSFHDWHIERMEKMVGLAGTEVKICELPRAHNPKNSC